MTSKFKILGECTTCDMKKAKRLDSVKEYYFSRKLKEVSRMVNSGNL